MKFTSLIKNAKMALPVIALILVSFYYLDGKIALFVKRYLMKKYSFLSSSVPDFLFVIVSAVTVVAASLYWYHRSRGIYTIRTRLFQIIAVSGPVAFLLKSILKYVFGGVNPRFWLRHQGEKEFLWFQGAGNYTGFPSGHMAVFCALLLAVADLYPRYRFFCYGILVMLGAALIATNYHFLSDVIAGFYLGVIVHFAVAKNLQSRDEVVRRSPLVNE